MPAVKQFNGRNGQQAASSTIIDIRGDPVEIDLKNEILAMINPENGPRKLPTLLLYDMRGLQLFEDSDTPVLKITYLDEYYLTGHEISILRAHARDIASKVPSGAILVELGSGNLRKVNLLLQAFEEAEKQIDYYALDLSRDELQRTLAELPDFNYVTCRGLWGTYDDGREWLKTIDDRPKSILHLGSSIGNFLRDEAAKFLSEFADVMQPQDTLFIGIDSFILNGLSHANTIFGQEIFHLPDWTVVGEYVYDKEGGRHQAFVMPLRDVEVMGHHIPRLERIKIEQSHKYSELGSSNLFKMAGLDEVDRWTRGDEYGVHQLRRAQIPFPLDPGRYAASVVPTPDEWRSLWTAWDTVTRQMLPEQDLAEKPIKLRNACIFYLGHIPAFLDIQLTKTTGQPPTAPGEVYYDMFERGIDPDVDDPERCHDHSELPSEWPPVDAIVAFQDRVRARLLSLYGSGPKSRGSTTAAGDMPRPVARAVWLGFEHEAMHLETLLYMMLQSPRTLPPPHTVRPDFERMARNACTAKVPNQWFDVPARTITIGLDDPEDEDDPTRHFGWDNEKPIRKQAVHSFQAKGRPITNQETNKPQYAQYMYATKSDQMPASWTWQETASPGSNSARADGTSSDSDLPTSFVQDKAVRTVYGLVPLSQALDWPVFASYDELSGCAAWMGGRIPTFEEARSIYAHVIDSRRKKKIPGQKLAATFPAVNGHLVNNGVQETPPDLIPAAVNGHGPDSGGEEEREDGLFTDLAGENVGLRHWHPVPVTQRGDTLAGQSGMGGVWEWTSSPLARHEGFAPMAMYPGYTADFLDGKHNVVLGGSWATHPRIAGRSSFVNWYQRKYPYAWVGARLVRDV
ncbi:L-histidine Nalpha-methyltransferase / hercynylcysteine S-oxide synthase [Geosmithia morbida]|uniref:L-histidine Nalpha-methyltransferase / hercynylcysteine S-oxide synthase n=1 Tax=Geosmithia morbida TaxID=1094350 RepID=A0A9P5D5Z2_9HYPO|nr:L-histidine Nalpha-methyltransferase / hercynylcysteine S-oxide synthase [Geosmithia morbida]KAF4122989.1 L-histidine Nalpha-methyltransferase / hercynylcysteine S-oxide synthase [Geosmithia morbida]